MKVLAIILMLLLLALIFNAQILEKTAFGLSDSVFGARTKVNKCFHSIFNKKQNGDCLVELMHL